MTTTQCTVSLANSTLLKINGDMTSTWWKQRPLNELNAKACRDRLNEIQMSGQTGSIDGGAADVLALL